MSLRVALDLRECLDPWTGMGRYGLEVTRALVRRGRHDYVGIVRRGAPIPRELADSRIELLHSSAAAYSPLEHLLLPGELRRARVDLLHAFTYALPLVSSVPTSMMLFDVVPILFPSAYRRRAHLYWRHVLPRTAATAARIGTLSRVSRDAIVRRFDVDPDKIRVLPAGVAPGSCVAPDDLPPALRGRRFILAHGNQRPHKNLASLLGAFARLNLLPENWDLVLAVSGGTESLLHQSSDRILELGRIDDRTLAALYHYAALYVLPSLYEGAGLTPLEAMSHGTPCVLSHGAALPELYGDVAVIAAPDPTELGDAITRVLGEPGLAATLREQGLARSRERSWGIAAAALEAMLEEASSA